MVGVSENRPNDAMNQQQLNGGKVTQSDKDYLLQLPTINTGYANAQIDDYAGKSRRKYPHRSSVHLALSARFSHASIVGTAGFGFWNAPYGDPTQRTPAFPKAIWFFYASPPNNLPFLHGQTGWFAATIDVKAWHLPLAPLAILNWLPKVQHHLWPRLTHRLGIRVAPIQIDHTQWHHYALTWTPQRTTFHVDGEKVLATTVSPTAPLGFVAWIDNQYLVASPKGRFGAGVLPLDAPQSLQIRDLAVNAERQGVIPNESEEFQSG